MRPDCANPLTDAEVRAALQAQIQPGIVADLRSDLETEYQAMIDRWIGGWPPGPESDCWIPIFHGRRPGTPGDREAVDSLAARWIEERAARLGGLFAESLLDDAVLIRGDPPSAVIGYRCAACGQPLSDTITLGIPTMVGWWRRSTCPGGCPSDPAAKVRP